MTNRSDRDWPVDRYLDNGNYTCWCHRCEKEFTGYKRRKICRRCDAELLGHVPGVMQTMRADNLGCVVGWESTAFHWWLEIRK